MHGKAQRADRVVEILERQLGIRVPSRDADLFAAGLVDSLSFINLLLHLESEFGVVIQLEQLDLEQFATVARIATFVDQEIADAPELEVRLASSTG